MANNNNRNCVNYRCSTEHINSLCKIAPNKSAGALLAAEVYFLLQGRTMEELRGKFTLPQLVAIVGAFEAFRSYPELMVDSNMFGVVMGTWAKRDDPFGRYLTAFPSVLSKLQSLTSAQCYFFQAEIIIFWKSYLGGGAPLEDIKEFCKKFL